ncbi:MAG TPA: formate dehydrogenase subunit gamma [Hyphomicrobiales bacterium]|nr:formate dehydrogenase subunit gamma [Hyphomicrobiales bacterium]
MTMQRTGAFSSRCLFAVFATLLVAVLIGGVGLTGPAHGQEVAPELRGQTTGGEVPGDALGTTSDSEFWRAVRQGDRGTVSIPDEKAARLIQSEGDNWRAIRNGPLSVYGVWVMLGMIILLALFFLLRGRIRIESGASGITVTRFTAIERFGHWMLAVSFVLHAITGLLMLYGRYAVKPVIGQETFSLLSNAGKWYHNYGSIAFMLGLVMVFVMWIIHNIPNRYDLVWLFKGGGMFTKHTHPPAKKFNAGQKIIFWLVILGGLSLSLSGIALMFPFQFSFFSDTFSVLNVLGLGLPTDFTPLQEQQLNQLWHAIVALVMIAVILAHIYIGTLGMEGAISAMWSGEVDLNWAREHHSVWVEDMNREPPQAGAAAQPAE